MSTYASKKLVEQALAKAKAREEKAKKRLAEERKTSDCGKGSASAPKQAKTELEVASGPETTRPGSTFWVYYNYFSY